MNKAILVIDMPNNCILCPLHDGEYGICNIVDEPHSDSDDISRKRDSLCPLKPLPKKYESKGYENGNELWWERERPSHHEIADPIYAQGYNDCIDEILGEEND